jgi:hypothetical protein
LSEVDKYLRILMQDTWLLLPQRVRQSSPLLSGLVMRVNIHRKVQLQGNMFLLCIWKRLWPRPSNLPSWFYILYLSCALKEAMVSQHHILAGFDEFLDTAINQNPLTFLELCARCFFCFEICFQHRLMLHESYLLLLVTCRDGFDSSSHFGEKLYQT